MKSEAQVCNKYLEVVEVCKKLEITLDNGEEIFILYKPETDPQRKAGGHEYCFWVNFDTVQEVWAFLQGYCTALRKDIHDL